MQNELDAIQEYGEVAARIACNSMNELESTPIAADHVKRKTVHGALSLGIRQLLVQAARVGASIVLARILAPAEFGIYAIVLYLQTFFTAFGDAGLAGSLIRQHDAPEIAEYRAIFTIQQMIVLLLSAMMWLASGWLASSYNLPPGEAWVFRIIALSFVATSFMVIPQVRLERNLEFYKVASVDSIQAIVFNGVAVLLAWKNFGAYSFAWALLARAVVGAVLVNWMSPWRMGWHWDWAIIKSHLSFGIPYQGIQAASLLKDSITPILIGFVLGTTDVGYITWAALVAAYPVMALMILQRVYMPAFARLQNHPTELASLVENVIRGTNVIAAPLSIITLALITPITTIVYGSKWLVALPCFYLFWIANLFVATATPILSLLNAKGRSKTALRFALIWMAGTWIVGAPIIFRFGAIGFPIASLVVQMSNVWLFRVAQKMIHFRIWRVILPGWVIAGVIGLLIYFLTRVHPVSKLSSLVAYGAGGLLVYGLSICAYYRQRIRPAWQVLRNPL